MSYKDFLFAVVLATFVFAVSVTLTGSVPVIRLMQYVVSVEDGSDIPSLTRAAVAYSTGWGTQQVTLSERAVFTPGEMEHLSDVRHVYQTVMLFGVLAVLLMISACVYRDLRNWAWRRRISIGTMLHRINVACIVLLLLLVIFFNRVFTAVHRVLFPAGTWEFPPEAILIRLFPGRFWILWCILTVVFIISLLGMLGVVLRQRSSIDSQVSAVKDR